MKGWNSNLDRIEEELRERIYFREINKTKREKRKKIYFKILGETYY